MNVVPLLVLTVEPSPPQIGELDVGGVDVDELEGIGTLLELDAATDFFGLITVK